MILNQIVIRNFEIFDLNEKKTNRNHTCRCVFQKILNFNNENEFRQKFDFQYVVCVTFSKHEHRVDDNVSEIHCETTIRKNQQIFSNFVFRL